MNDGKGVIANCNVGHGIKITEADDGRGKIEVDPSPPCAQMEGATALRHFMEETAVAWLQLVAPHRLS